uniref:Mitochondrial inner membrane protease subunit n=1 Tax=Chromera velia CCMP2878 TaxID=1169474 RepID=A0A0G4F2C0_9ALVE|eukprot:Cvel_14880.t1-p1 / transcript=Cvel_14880.t1 / gene=Cvel_14880 / organism=Chromera_velia_CCMP2878 / gene_product=Probable signal peptidase I-1, putative / transcript_product=Probable signal peptidase I-1, putative / location=Cvel_scaffold1076:33753-36763(+) / protein_length=361 / sequence_SO=supercontig / SO=protein_coding / is_pseudo=false
MTTCVSSVLFLLSLFHGVIAFRNGLLPSNGLLRRRTSALVERAERCSVLRALRQQEQESERAELEEPLSAETGRRGMDLEGGEEQGEEEQFGPFELEDLKTFATYFCGSLLIRTFLLEPRSIPSLSMFPTLDIGDDVMVEKVVKYEAGKTLPNRRDVLVFFPPEQALEGTQMGIDKWSRFQVSGRAAGSLMQALSVSDDKLGSSSRSLSSLLADRGKGTSAKTVPLSENFFADVEIPPVGGWGKDDGPLDGLGRRKEIFTGEQLDRVYIKRCVAVEGDEVKMDNGVLFVNGRPQEEGYKNEPARYSFGPLTVPKGHVLMLGDNRNASYDSHIWGFLPLQNILGHAVFKYFPIQHIGPIPTS